MTTKKKKIRLIGLANLDPIRKRGSPEHASFLFGLRSPSSQQSGGLKSRRSAGKHGRTLISSLSERRVVVKARVVKQAGSKSLKLLRAHLIYLERSGTGLDKDRPTFISCEREFDRKDISKLVAEWGKDPHHFRFIISPEDASKINLEDYARSVLGQIQKELRVKFEWYAVSHHNTDNPHIHALVRGVDSTGKALYFERDFVKNGFRIIAQKEATRLLGKRPEQEIQGRREEELLLNRVTFLDRKIENEVDKATRIFTVQPLRSQVREFEKLSRQQLIKRLHHLAEHGLVRELKAGKWKIESDFHDVLSSLKRREEIEKTVHTILKGTDDVNRTLRIHGDGDSLPRPLVGEVIEKNLYDEINGKRFVLVRAADGNIHFVPIGRYAEGDGFECKPGAIISLSTEEKRGRTDEILARDAAESGGIFNVVQLHERLSQTYDDATALEIAERFQARAEGLERLGILQNAGPLSWKVPDNLKDRIKEIESKLKVKKNKFKIELRSTQPLIDLAENDYSTWLDELIENEIAGKKDTIPWFANSAVRTRYETLKRREIKITPGYSDLLYSQELAHHAANYTQIGKFIRKPRANSVGRIDSYLTLGKGHHAVVRFPNGFSILPVRPGQEKFDGQREVKVSSSKHGEITFIPVSFRRNVKKEKKVMQHE